MTLFKNILLSQMFIFFVRYSRASGAA